MARSLRNAHVTTLHVSQGEVITLNFIEKLLRNASSLHLIQLLLTLPPLSPLHIAESIP